MNAQMKNENVVENATTPCFTYDHINHKIVGTELNFRKSGIPGSAQDMELMARLAQHPNYTFQIIKPAKEKNSYKGLTCPLMAEYLEMTRQEVLSATLKKMRDDVVVARKVPAENIRTVIYFIRIKLSQIIQRKQ